MINSRILSKAINEELKPFGFKRKGSTWYLQKEEVIGVLNVQKSNYDSTFFLNIGFWLLQLGEVQNPKEEQCHVRSRASELWPDGDPSIGVLLCEDGHFSSEEERINAIQLFIREKIVPLIVNGANLSGLTELLVKKEGFLIRYAARQQLGLEA